MNLDLGTLALILAALATALRTSASWVNDLRKEKNTLADQVKVLESEKEKAEKDKTYLQQQVDDLKAQFESFKTVRLEEKESLNQEITDLKEKVTAFETQVHKLGADLAKKEQENATLQAALSVSEAERERVTRDKIRIATERDQLADEKQRWEQQMETVQQQMDRVQAQIQEFLNGEPGRKREMINAARDEAKKQVDDAEERINLRVDGKLDNISSQLQHIDDMLANMSSGQAKVDDSGN